MIKTSRFSKLYLALFLIVFGGLGAYKIVSTHAASGSSVALFNRINYGTYSTPLTTSQEANRYQFMDTGLNVVQNGRLPLAALHAANPNLKVLMYQDVMQEMQNDQSGPSTTGCTTYSANNPASWYATDAAGHRIVNVSTPPNSSTINVRYLMNVNDPSYQAACAAQASTLAKQNGFDGVFFDDVGWYGFYHWYDAVTGAVVPTSVQNPNASTWFNGLVALSNVVGPAVHAQGLLAIGNVADYGGVPSIINADTSGFARVVSPLDGSMEESWTDGGPGVAQQVPYWPHKLANAAWSAANHKYELLHSHSGTETDNTYGLAAMMLVANGYASYTVSNTNYSTQENWFPEYPLAQSLGQPLGPYSQSQGVYIRHFTNGVVVVNPTSSSASNISLGGTYSGAGNEPTNVTSINVGPTSGYILAGSVNVQPPPAPSVSITAPANGASISGHINLGASASSTDGIASVLFQVDGSSIGSPVTSSPYQISWDSSSVANGTHTITAVATSVAGANASSSVTVTVSNGSTGGGGGGSSKAVCNPNPCTPGFYQTYSINVDDGAGNIVNRSFTLERPNNLVNSGSTKAPLLVQFVNNVQNWPNEAASGKFIDLRIPAIHSSSTGGQYADPIVANSSAGGFSSCGASGSQKCDDIPWVQTLIQDLETCSSAHGLNAPCQNVDSSKVFATGGSRGGTMAEAVACDPRTTNLFSGIAPISALLIAYNSPSANPSDWHTYPNCPALFGADLHSGASVTINKNMSALWIYGDKDSVFTSSTCSSNCLGPGYSQPKNNKWFWGDDQMIKDLLSPVGGCSTSPTNSVINGVSTVLEHLYASCSLPNRAFATIEYTNGPHQPEGTDGVYQAPLIWKFFATYDGSGSITPPPPPPPTVSLSANPATVDSGSSSTLSWTSTNATSCNASGSWSGSEPTSGSSSTGALTSSSNYVLSCSGSGGSAQSSTTVTVKTTPPPPPPPTVSLSANPATVDSGSSSTLSWTSTNATSCNASGSWSGSEPTSGSSSTGALSANANYTLSCSGNGGTAQSSTTVSVNNIVTPPSTPLGLHSSNVTSSSVSLSWNSSTPGSNSLSGYYIVRDGTTIGQSVSTSYTDSAVQPGQSYTYQVMAFDSSGNTSALTSGVGVTTPPVNNPQPPPAPTGLSAQVVSASQVNLSWNSSSDSSVIGYHVYRDGTSIANTSATSFGDTGLSSSSSHSYYVIAYNSVGNSPASSTVTATTQSSGGGGNNKHHIGQISGRVRNSNSNLNGVEVAVVYKDSDHFSLTNNEGRYEARDIPAGEHIIVRFSKPGYYSQSFTVRVRERRVSIVNVKLNPIFQRHRR